MRQLRGGMKESLQHGVLQVVCALLVTLLGVGGALAHHSFAMYDSDHQIKLKGTVSSFEWNNPHVYIELSAPDDQGATKAYTVECASPGILTRIIAPLKTGEPGGLLKQVTLADGRKFGNGGPAGKPNIE
jgi:hypothetical protein